MGNSRSIDPARHGLRALVTRPRAEAESLAEALAARGIAAIIEPLLEIHYRSEAAADLAGVQAVLCTSANGVRALARLTGERALPLFAVGEASAARAREEGFARVESAGGSAFASGRSPSGRTGRASSWRSTGCSPNGGWHERTAGRGRHGRRYRCGGAENACRAAPSHPRPNPLPLAGEGRVGACPRRP